MADLTYNSDQIEEILRQLPDPQGMLFRMAPQEMVIVVDAIEKAVLRAGANIALRQALTEDLNEVGEEMDIKDLDKKIDIEGLTGRLSPSKK